MRENPAFNEYVGFVLEIHALTRVDFGTFTSNYVLYVLKFHYLKSTYLNV